MLTIPIRLIAMLLCLWGLEATLATSANAQAQRSDAFAAMAQTNIVQLSSEARDTLRAMEGLVFLDGMQLNTSKSGQLIASGTLDFSRLPSSSANPASNAMRLAMLGAGSLLSTFGVPSTWVPMSISVGPGQPSPSLALLLDFTVPNASLREVAISPPEMGTKLMVNNLTLRLSATQPIAKPVPGAAFGLGGTAKLFVKPTAADPWLDFSPTLSVNTLGQLFISGTLAGACTGTPSAFAVCNGEWNLLGLGLARARAARLDLTFQGQQVIRTHAEVSDGWLGPANDIGVSGVVIAVAGSASSGGIALTTKGAPTVQGLVAAFSPFGYAFAKVAGITDNMPNPRLPISGQATVIATPFAISGGGYNITQPTLGFQLAAGGGGMNVNVRAAAESDIWALLKKQPLAAAPRGSAAFSATIDNAQLKSDVVNAAKTLFGQGFSGVTGEFLDLAMSGFTFQGASTSIEMTNPGAAQAELRFSLGNKAFAPRVKAEDAVRPAQAIAALVKTEVESLLTLQCAPSEEKVGLLCYTKCRSGFYGDGRTCRRGCPELFKDWGNTCEKPDYWIKGDYSTEKKCEAEQGRQCEKKGAIWYATCFSGYEKTTLFRCRAIACPSGGGWGSAWKDYGDRCEKPADFSYDRGRARSMK